MKRKNSGFTLVEIIVSLTLICIIAMAMIPAFAVQLKMMIDTKDITMESFDAQGSFEETISELKTALLDPAIDEDAVDGVTSPDLMIFGRSVTLYKVAQDFPGNNLKEFIVFLSRELTEMESLISVADATGVYIQVSDEASNSVAALKNDPKPTLIGHYNSNTDPNFYGNLYKWYVSKVGDPDPQWPEDYERITFAGVTPATLTNLTTYPNRYIVFTVTSVDIHGVRGNEVVSSNKVFVLGEEWRAGVFAWVDKNEDIYYTSGTDVLVENPSLKKTFGNTTFRNPSLPETELDPADGSLYIPMNLDVSNMDVVDPIEISTGLETLEWIMDKGINLANDINVSNISYPNIYMKAEDGNIVLYQYIQISGSEAVFQANGMPVLVEDGPALSAPYGDITFETGSAGEVIIQSFSSLDAGDDISMTPYGNVSIFQSAISAGGGITIDTTKGVSYPSNRDISIEDSLVSLDSGAAAGRGVILKTLDSIDLSNTIFNGNPLATSYLDLTAPEGIVLDAINMNDCTVVNINNDAVMTAGGWDADSTMVVADGATIQFQASGTKVNNEGALVLGDTGGITFKTSMASDLASPVAINLGKASDAEVSISTTYGRNVGLADSSDAEYIEAYGEYQELGSGTTNLEYTVVKSSGYGSPVLTYTYDGTDTIGIQASGIGPISAYYTMTVSDKYAEDVTGTIVFRVRAAEGESPTVTVIGTAIPTFNVTFDKNGGNTDADPSVLAIKDGEPIGTLPEPPTRTGYSFTNWTTEPGGGGSEVTAATVITEDITVYAQYTLIPVYTVTFNRNGGTTDAVPATMLVEQGSPIDTLPEPPTKTGYWFQNWSTTPTGGTLISASTVINGDLTAYAQWTVKKRFSDITQGEYISINGVLFQKITNTQILRRSVLSTSTPVKWSTAYTDATNYYTTFSTSYSWVLNSGLVDGNTLTSTGDNGLGNSRRTILNIGMAWWGGSRNVDNAYLVRDNGRINNSEPKGRYNFCRPYLQLDTAGLYVTYGSGTSADPYILAKD